MVCSSESLKAQLEEDKQQGLKYVSLLLCLNTFPRKNLPIN